MDLNEIARACAKAKDRIAPRGMGIGPAFWDQIVGDAQRVKPRSDGLMEYCGLKVFVDELIPPNTIVWTDDGGGILHITKIEPGDRTTEPKS